MKYTPQWNRHNRPYRIVEIHMLYEQVTVIFFLYILCGLQIITVVYRKL